MPRNHRITRSGLMFLGITAFVFLAAANSGTNLLFLALGLMVGGFVVAAALSRLTLSKLDVRRIITDHIVAGEPADLQYQITNRKRRWPCFAIHITEVMPATPTLANVHQAYALHIPPTRSVTVPATLLATRRGLIRFARFASRAPFPSASSLTTSKYRSPKRSSSIPASAPSTAASRSAAVTPPSPAP